LVTTLVGWQFTLRLPATLPGWPHHDHTFSVTHAHVVTFGLHTVGYTFGWVARIGLHVVTRCRFTHTLPRLPLWFGYRGSTRSYFYTPLPHLPLPHVGYYVTVHTHTHLFGLHTRLPGFGLCCYVWIWLVGLFHVVDLHLICYIYVLHTHTLFGFTTPHTFYAGHELLSWDHTVLGWVGLVTLHTRSLQHFSTTHTHTYTRSHTFATQFGSHLPHTPLHTHTHTPAHLGFPFAGPHTHTFGSATTHHRSHHYHGYTRTAAHTTLHGSHGYWRHGRSYGNWQPAGCRSSHVTRDLALGHNIARHRRATTVGMYRCLSLSTLMPSCVNGSSC